MDTLSIDRWVEAQVPRTMEAWQQSEGLWNSSPRHYTPTEQAGREKAYDRALREVRREATKASRTHSASAAGQIEQRLVASFARFAAAALDLDDAAIGLLTRHFLPIGTQLARWARKFDSSLSTGDIIQASRNAWTACGLQPLLGAPMELTPAILAYSLLYPYTDNYLDQQHISRGEKLRFSEKFRCRLRGERLSPVNHHERSVWTMVQLIEEQYPRDRYPAVFESLLAIHCAQEQSLAQLGNVGRITEQDLLRISCFKGGTSVLADAFLVHGHLTAQQSRFAFEWGVLLQLGDDLQDVHEDLERASDTLFTRAVRSGCRLDDLASQLLNFSDVVAAQMIALPHGDETHNALLRMSWRSLILMAVAQAHECFSPAMLDDLERCSPFRFAFLRSRRETLDGDSGLIERLFQILLAGGSPVPLPHLRRNFDRAFPAHAPELVPAPAFPPLF
jgi:hypothetical protein